MQCHVIIPFAGTSAKEVIGYPGNFEYAADQENIKNGHGKSGYIKAEQFYYFDSEKLDYYVLGSIHPDLLQALFQYIESLEEIEHIIDNL